MSAFCTAAGLPAASVPTTVHGMLRLTRESVDNPADKASQEDVRGYFEQLSFYVRNSPLVQDSRRERVLSKIAAAVDALPEGTPDNATLEAWKMIPVQIASGMPSTDSSGRTSSGRGPRPYHKRFSRFSKETLSATDELFSKRPSRMTHEERDEAFREWIGTVSSVYDMEPPTFQWDEDADMGGGGFYRLSDHSITMSPNHPSITTLIHEFRHALQHTNKGAPMVDEDVEVDARAWSLSLYYQVRPALFERLVREGRIFHITPEDLDR